MAQQWFSLTNVAAFLGSFLFIYLSHLIYRCVSIRIRFLKLQSCGLVGGFLTDDLACWRRNTLLIEK